ncbi:hypothetical protein ES703_20554 [subsurface metagenome]
MRPPLKGSNRLILTHFDSFSANFGRAEQTLSVDKYTQSTHMSTRIDHGFQNVIDGLKNVIKLMSFCLHKPEVSNRTLTKSHEALNRVVRSNPRGRIWRPEREQKGKLKE